MVKTLSVDSSLVFISKRNESLHKVSFLQVVGADNKLPRFCRKRATWGPKHGYNETYKQERLQMRNNTSRHPGNAQLGSLRTCWEFCGNFHSVGKVVTVIQAKLARLMQSRDIIADRCCRCKSTELTFATSQLLQQMCFHAPIYASILFGIWQKKNNNPPSERKRCFRHHFLMRYFKNNVTETQPVTVLLNKSLEGHWHRADQSNLRSPSRIDRLLSQRPILHRSSDTLRLLTGVRCWGSTAIISLPSWGKLIFLPLKWSLLVSWTGSNG